MGMEHYVRIRDLGGNSGAFLAIDRQTPAKKVVIKRLADGAQGMEELKASLSVQHPNIIHFLESFVYEGNLYVVLRHEAGGDMDNLLTRLLELHKLPTTHTLLMWYAQLLDALAHCHTQRIIHRDIKPSNIFVSEDTKTLYLGDFGSAKELTSSNLTSTFVGSPLWISPEVLQGKSYTFSSDIWSLGCVFYEMACLHRPFSGNCFARLVNEITTGSLAPLPDKILPIIKEVITRMLALNPSERPTAAEVLVVVRRALESEKEMQKPNSSAPRRPGLSPRNLRLMTPRQEVQGPVSKTAIPLLVLSPKIPHRVVKNRSQSKTRHNFSRYMTTSVLSRSHERPDSPPLAEATVKFSSSEDQVSAARVREHHASMLVALSPARHAPSASPVRVRSAEPFQQPRNVRSSPYAVGLYQGGGGKAGGQSPTSNSSNGGACNGTDHRMALEFSPRAGQDSGACGTEAKKAMKEHRAGASEKSVGQGWLSPVLLVIPSSNKTRTGPRPRKRAPNKKPHIPTTSIVSSRSHRSASELASASAATMSLCSPYAHNLGSDSTSNMDRQVKKRQKNPNTEQTPTPKSNNGRRVAEMTVEALGAAIPSLHQPSNAKVELSRLAKMSTCQRSEKRLFISPEGACNGGMGDKHGNASAASGLQGKAPRSQTPQPPPVARRAQAAAERNKQRAIPQSQNAIPQRPRLKPSLCPSASSEEVTGAREATQSVCKPQLIASTADARNTSSEFQKKRWLLELNHDVTDIENYLCRFREHDQHVLHANSTAPSETKRLQRMERIESDAAKRAYLRQASFVSLIEQIHPPAGRDVRDGSLSNKSNPSPFPKSNAPNALREEARRLAQEKREVQRAKLKEWIRQGRAKTSEGKAVNGKKLNIEIKIPQQFGSKGNKMDGRVNCLEAV